MTQKTNGYYANDNKNKSNMMSFNKVVVKRGTCRHCGDPEYCSTGYCWECYKYEKFESR